MVALLIAVAIAAAAAATTATRWSDELRHEHEQELLRVGDAIAAGIASYRRASAGSAIKYPPQLEDLLEDRRAFGTIRHLRQLYADPVNRGAPWGLLRATDGGVMGVYSLSEGSPFARVARKLAHVDLKPAARYADWHFVPRDSDK